MCWKWEEYISKNWLKEQNKQGEKQELAEEKESEKISEEKEESIRSEAPIYKYLKSDADLEDRNRRKAVKTR